MSKRETVKSGPYTPLTGAPCSCRRGIERDNCPQCEGTGKRIDFQAIHARRNAEESGKAPGWLAEELGPATAGAILRALDRPATPKNPQGPQPGSAPEYSARIRERLGEAKVAELLAHLPKGSLIWSYDTHRSRTGTLFYGLRVFYRGTADLPHSNAYGLAADCLGGAPVLANQTFYLGRDVAEAMGATFKQTQYWMGWHGDLHPARAVALLGVVLYGTPDAFSHRGIA